MLTEEVLEDRKLQKLRKNNIIENNEVAIKSGDLYFAKNVLTEEKRLIDRTVINNILQNESISESNSRTLLKG